MLSNRRFAVVGYKIPRDCIIKSNGINGSLNEAWQLLIEETFGINKTAYTKCGSEYMNLSYFTCVRVSISQAVLLTLSSVVVMCPFIRVIESCWLR